MITKCPICDGGLRITEVVCRSCGTKISGSFAMNRLLELSEEQLNFVMVFLKCRGNIKEVERELDISYPTVRNRLDSVIKGLGFTNTSLPDGYADILDELGSGELDVDTAVKAIERRRRGQN